MKKFVLLLLAFSLTGCSAEKARVFGACKVRIMDNKIIEPGDYRPEDRRIVFDDYLTACMNSKGYFISADKYVNDRLCHGYFLSKDCYESATMCLFKDCLGL